ncbi:hypothetical protein [Acetobacter orientalis]|uniref:hypothetical protein n=1 Tax=Acetobacter orientalis TaxID=146474 RepID=UPI0039E7C406
MSKKPILTTPRGPFKKRTLRQHILRRLALVLPISLLVIVLDKSGMLETIADRYTFKPESWFENTALTQHLRVLMTHNGMVHTPAKCLIFSLKGDDPPTASTMRVMEQHTGNCPGPKGETSELFTLRIDRLNKVIMSDQGSPGTFHPIP